MLKPILKVLKSWSYKNRPVILVHQSVLILTSQACGLWGCYCIFYIFIRLLVHTLHGSLYTSHVLMHSQGYFYIFHTCQYTFCSLHFLFSLSGLSIHKIEFSYCPQPVFLIKLLHNCRYLWLRIALMHPNIYFMITKPDLVCCCFTYFLVRLLSLSTVSITYFSHEKCRSWIWRTWCLKYSIDQWQLSCKGNNNF